MLPRQQLLGQHRECCALRGNGWGDHKTGLKHYIFGVNNCISDETPSGFYNEYLLSDLRPHRKVFELLGREMQVASSDNQISGFGFSKKNDKFSVQVDGKPYQVIV